MDGVIQVSVSGGTKPYSFSIDGNTWITDSVFSALHSRLYSMRVKDGVACTVTLDTFLITTADFEDLIVSSDADNSCSEDNGSISIEFLNGNPAYEFNLDETGFVNDVLFQDLKDGEHTLTIKSNEGCFSTISVMIDRVNSGTSWSTEILPIMTTYCAKSGCHNGVSRNNDWRIYDQVKQNAAIIKQKTLDRSMPFDQLLPQDKIDLIQCWVDEGALNN